MGVFRFIIYNISKLLLIIGFNLYFRKAGVRNKKNLKLDRPTILVSNHPNTLLDPLNCAFRVNAMVYFLANYGLFKTKFSNWFFTNFFSIPIQRPQDMEGKAIENDAAFSRSSEFLVNGGTLFVAVQGVSSMKRQINKVKTGTARIALSAEASHNFDVGLQILPIGLNYSTPTKFQGDMFVNVGEPIFPAEYRSQYEDDNFMAAQAITDEIKSRLIPLIIDTQDEEEDKIVSHLELIHFQPDRPDPATAFDATQKIISDWRSFKQRSPSKAKKLAENMNAFFTDLEKHDLNIHQINGGKHSSLLMSIFGFPIFLWGWINNFLSVKATLGVVKKLNTYIGYNSSIKMVGGIFIFGFIYFFQLLLVNFLFHNSWITLVYALLLIPTGLFAWKYFQNYSMKKKEKRFSQLDVPTQDHLKKQYKTILEVCENEIFES